MPNTERNGRSTAVDGSPAREENNEAAMNKASPNITTDKTEDKDHRKSDQSDRSAEKVKDKSDRSSEIDSKTKDLKESKEGKETKEGKKEDSSRSKDKEHRSRSSRSHRDRSSRSSRSRSSGRSRKDKGQSRDGDREKDRDRERRRDDRDRDRDRERGRDRDRERDRDRDRDRDSRRHRSSRRSRSSSRSRRHRRSHRSRSRSGSGGRSSRSRRHRSRSRSRSRSRDRSKKKSKFTDAPPDALLQAQGQPQGGAGAGAGGGGILGAGTLLGAAPGMPPSLAGLLAQQSVNPATAALLSKAAAASSSLAGAGAASGLPPGLSPALPLMGLGMTPVDPTTKTRRELFVGNTPPGTTEPALMAYLNAAMLQVKLNTMPGNPIIQTRVNNKFAFVELRSIEETDNMLNLNGIPFMGQHLRVGRPSKYAGPVTPYKTWQELTGQAPLESEEAILDPNTKLSRELFVGNIPPGTDEKTLLEFLYAAFTQVGLNAKPGNPILHARINDKFAFIELRSIDETNAMLNLTGIPFMGQVLRVGRPSKYAGPVVPHRSWDELVADLMAGKALGGPGILNPTRVVRLSNMVEEEELRDDEEFEEILEDTEEECGKFGQVVSVKIPRPGKEGEQERPPGLGKVFVEFSNVEEAAKALAALQGRTFGGNTVEATFFSEELYEQGQYEEEPGTEDGSTQAENGAAATAEQQPQSAQAVLGAEPQTTLGQLPTPAANVGLGGVGGGNAPLPGMGRGKGLTLPSWMTASSSSSSTSSS